MGVEKRGARVKHLDHSRLYSTAIRQASDAWGTRPWWARLCRVGNGASQAEHRYPFNLDGSRVDDRFETCEKPYMKLDTCIDQHPPEGMRQRETHIIILGLI